MDIDVRVRFRSGFMFFSGCLLRLGVVGKDKKPSLSSFYKNYSANRPKSSPPTNKNGFSNHFFSEPLMPELIAILVAVLLRPHALLWGFVAAGLVYVSLDGPKRKKKALAYGDLAIADKAVFKKIFETSPVLLGQDTDTPLDDPYPAETRFFKKYSSAHIASSFLVAAVIAAAIGFWFFVPAFLVGAAWAKGEGVFDIPSNSGIMFIFLAIGAAFYLHISCVALAPIGLFYPKKRKETVL